VKADQVRVENGGRGRRAPSENPVEKGGQGTSRLPVAVPFARVSLRGAAYDG